MADTPPVAPLADDSEQRLAGQRVAFVGRLVGMPRREATRIVRLHGGTCVEAGDAPSLTVLGDDHAATADGAQLVGEPLGEVVGEAEFWQRLGLIDDCEVRRLHTPAMLADLLGVPSAAIRRWVAQGWLRPTRSIHRLPYFDFQETSVARRLADMHRAGCSLDAIDRRLRALARRMPQSDRPLVDPDVIVEGQRLLLRRGDALAEPTGQRLLDFEPSERESSAAAVASFDEAARADDADERVAEAWHASSLAQQLEQEAGVWEEQADYRRAAETYRTLLMACGPTAERQFALAEALYRAGDLSAARERYYATLELEEQFVEARSNLGCVLAETGELELAAEAFRGALSLHPDFADVHFHLAGVLDRLGLVDEATLHYRKFLALAPESPWAPSACDRLQRSDELILPRGEPCV